MSKLAVFFDAENVPAEKVPQVVVFLCKDNDVLYQRAYADWSMRQTSSWKDQLYKTPITAIQVFHETNGSSDKKESVDKAIMMDSIVLAAKNSEIDTFAIVTSDNGFYSLALRLRELGKKVIGIGEKEKCHSRWVRSCNEFRYFGELDEIDDDILSDEGDNNGDNAFDDFSLETFLLKAFDSTRPYRDTESVLNSQMSESIYRLKSDFNVRNYGCNTMIELIRKFDSVFEVTDDGKPQKTFFISKREFDVKGKRLTGIIKRRIRTYRIVTADDGSGDYFFYVGDVNKEFRKEIFDKDARVDFLVKKTPSRDAQNTKDKNGKAFDVRLLKNDAC